MSKHGKLPFNPIIWPAVPHDFDTSATGNNNLGYYTTETTQRYAWGTRGMTWDGKVYRYGRVKNTVYAGFAVVNSATTTVTELINTSHPQTIEIGDREVLITVADAEGYGAGAVAEDELVGAMFVVGHGTETTTETRTVIGNDAIADGGNSGFIYVDEPFAIKHTTGFMELPLNTYGYLIKPSDAASGFMGVPNITASAGDNLWIQTWGLCWCIPGDADSDIGSTVIDRTVVFAGDGSVNGADILTARSYQAAGFITDATTIGQGCMPMVMLQISI